MYADRLNTFLIFSTVLWSISSTVFADVMVSSTVALHAEFSALLPPFTTWKNRDETINLPFSMGSTTHAPLEVVTSISPFCPHKENNTYAVCMTNTGDSKAAIYYTLKYIPCSSLKPFYLSSNSVSSTKIILDAKYTDWSRCNTQGGIMSFTRLSLFEKPLPPSGLYRSIITLEVKEI